VSLGGVDGGSAQLPVRGDGSIKGAARGAQGAGRECRRRPPQVGAQGEGANGGR